MHVLKEAGSCFQYVSNSYTSFEDWMNATTVYQVMLQLWYNGKFPMVNKLLLFILHNGLP